MFGNAFKVGKLAGIDIKISWSLIVICVLLMFSFSSFVSGASFNSLLVWLTSIVVAAGCIGSILAHEFAHALTGRSMGIHFNNITLHMFGGAAMMSNYPKTPKQEGIMAIAGPISSAMLSFFFFVCFVVSATLSGKEPSLIAYAFYFLYYINMILAVFNMLPAFPLDGGRVLRSLLWWKYKSVQVATMKARTVSVGLSYAMMGAGVLMALGLTIPFLGTGLFNGIWIGVLGYLIKMMADAELHSLNFRR